MMCFISMSAIGTKRTCRFALHMFAIDPTATSGLIAIYVLFCTVSTRHPGAKC
jgi:hypothetical protein